MGVPQGSLLGPLLYLCYCNDIEIATKCKVILYADDSLIIYNDKDPRVIENILSTELQSVNQWLIENKLSLHPGKCEAILFASKRKANENFCIKFNDINIVGSQSVKYLGTILENDLSGKECVNKLVKKANAKLKFLYRYRSVLNKHTRKILAMSLVQSQLDYASMAWYYGINVEHKHRLQVTQNRIIRFILDMHPREHVGQKECIKTGLLNVENRVAQLGLNIVHRIYYHGLPEYLEPFFIRLRDTHDHNTRGSHYNFKVPKTNSVILKTFTYNAIKLWNLIPDTIKVIESYTNFKRSLKKHLLNSITI